jgi:hypothetical protein
MVQALVMTAGEQRERMVNLRPPSAKTIVYRWAVCFPTRLRERIAACVQRHRLK